MTTAISEIKCFKTSDGPHYFAGPRDRMLSLFMDSGLIMRSSVFIPVLEPDGLYRTPGGWQFIPVATEDMLALCSPVEILNFHAWAAMACETGSQATVD